MHFIGSAAGCFHQVHPSLGGLGNYSPHHVRCVIIPLLYASPQGKSTLPGAQGSHGLNSDPFFAANETQAFCGCRLDADVPLCDPQRLR